MNDFRLFNNPDVFAVDIGDLIENYKKYLLVYSPLTDSAFVCNADFARKLEQRLKYNLPASDSLDDFVEQIQEFSNYPAGDIAFEEVKSLVILPTAACNFRCSYCYSRFSRNQDSLNLSQIMAVCEKFLTQNTKNPEPLNIVFMGGGEPVLFSGLLQAITWCREYANKHKINLNIQLVTNGSLLSGAIAEKMISEQVTVIFSFEILKDIQNNQRGQYDVVRKNIENFLAAGGQGTIRATVTALNVDLQETMIQELKNCYPNITGVIFEPVLDTERLGTEELFTDFFNKFSDNYFKALELADQYGINLTTSLHRRADASNCRYCLPEWNVTPNGEFTICHRLSSVEDKGFTENSYGRVENDGSIIFDREKWENILQSDTNLSEHCKDCFARWNCAGGCRIQNLHYSAEIISARCRLTRTFLKKILLLRIEKLVKREFGAESLEQWLSQGENA